MLTTLRSEDLIPRGGPLRRLSKKAWREWCFARSLLERLWPRLVVLFVVLMAGGVLFMRLEPERGHSFAKAVFLTFGLIFGEPAEEFPEHPVLQGMFFLVPIVGLTIIIEGIVELATLVRDRRRNERAWCRIMAESMRNHIVLVGMGRLGYRTYVLLRQLSIPVVVLEVNEKNSFLQDVRNDGVPLFVGDARRESLLVDANVKDAKAVILATTDDLANLEIALDARKLNPDVRVVLRMFDQNMADKIRDGFNIHIAMSQSAISAPAFATAALESDIVASTIIDHQLVVTLRRTVAEGDALDGQTIAEVMGRSRAHVLRLLRKSVGAETPILFPNSGEVLRAGDEVFLQGLYDHVREFAPAR
ncbi:MAG: NAD-binding protein [Phycisphaerales bacterium]